VEIFKFYNVKMPRKIKHGMCKSTEYIAWSNLIRRCADPDHPSYANYGGRGITVCERWRSSFENFISDMGKKPSPELSIDRIDNDGPYAPWNCRWTTTAVQKANARTNGNYRYITYRGETKTMLGWAKTIGVSNGNMHKRLSTMSIEDAMRKPKKPLVITHNGKTMDLNGWSEHLGITVSALFYRLRRMSAEEAVSIARYEHCNKDK
jgi:hypothetical protein